MFLRAQIYTTTLQVILTCSSPNHQMHKVYTTALQAIFSRIYWIFFDVPSHAKLHYNTTGDFNMLISKPPGCTRFTLQHYRHYFHAYIGFFSIFLRAQSYTTTLQVILTCSSQNHQDAQVYTTTLQ